MQNPVWWQQWQLNLKGNGRPPAIAQMRALLNGPNAPTTQIANNARNLLKGYDNYTAELVSETGFSSEQAQTTRDWKNFLYNAVAQDPGITNLVTGMFMSVTPPTTLTNVPYSATPGSFTAQSWNQAG
jgi:hypothetical protein